MNDTTCYLEKNWAEYLEIDIGSIYVAETLAMDDNKIIQRYNASYNVVGLFSTSMFISQHDSSGNPITSLRMDTTRNGLESEFGNIGLQSAHE